MNGRDVPHTGNILPHKTPLPGIRNSLFKLLVREIQVILKTKQAIAVAFGCLSEVEGKILLLKIYTLDIRPRRFQRAVS